MREPGDGSSPAEHQDDDDGGEGGGGAPGSPTIRYQTSVTDVPDELLQLCFARLPVRFVHRVKAVCKRWYSLVGGHSDHHHLRKLRRALGVTEPWTLVLANGFAKNGNGNANANANAAFRGLQGHAYDLSSQATLPIATLHTPHRVLFGVTVGTDAIVYVLGGRSPLISWKPNEWEVFTRVDAYDLFRNRWALVPAMTTARYAFAAGAYVDPATHHPMLIAAGGYDAHGQALPFAEVFDVHTREWERIPKMLHLTGACRGYVVNANFYVTQANAGPHCVEEYSSVKKRWSRYPGPDKMCFHQPPNGCVVSLYI